MSARFPALPSENPGEQNDNVAFFEDTHREVKQTAFFGSMDFDIIPKVLTITAGTRHYNFDNKFVGSVTSSFYCFEQGVPAGGCINGGTNLDAKNLSFNESGFKSRANIAWHVTPDVMVYATWSQGFRPGGFNRQGSSTAGYIPGPDGKNQFAIPSEYHSDDLTNKEVGWKTEFFDHRFQWNGALYQENWDNVQIGFFDPGETGNLAFGTNGQNFRIRGIETSIVAVLFQGFTLQGGAAWNSSEQTNSPAADHPSRRSDHREVRQGHRRQSATPSTTCSDRRVRRAPIRRPFSSTCARVMTGRSTAITPSCSLAASMSAIRTPSRAAIPSISSGGISTTLLRFENPAYTTYDASLGVAKDAWSAHIYAQNLTNVEVPLFTNTAQFVVAQTALRPRVLGFKFYYKF